MVAWPSWRKEFIFLADFGKNQSEINLKSSTFWAFNNKAGFLQRREQKHSTVET